MSVNETTNIIASHSKDKGMGYKDENLNDRMGIEGRPKYQCPHCKKALRISKPPFMLICNGCKYSKRR